MLSRKSEAEPLYMIGILEDKGYASKPKFIPTLLMHQFVGTIGVMLLAGLLTTIAFEFPNPWGRILHMRDVYRVLTGTPYFPVQIVVALLCGWLVSDLFGHQSMRWIWVLPYAWLVYAFARLPTVLGMTFQERLSHFFGWSCRPENRCFDQTGITLPFYAAFAYSLGALLAYKMPMRSPGARAKISGVVFTIGAIVLADAVKSIAFHLKDLLAQVPQGWGWIGWVFVLLAAALVTGIGACLIFFALKMKRIHRGC